MDPFWYGPYLVVGKNRNPNQLEVKYKGIFKRVNIKDIKFSHTLSEEGQNDVLTPSNN